MLGLGRLASTLWDAAQWTAALLQEVRQAITTRLSLRRRPVWREIVFWRRFRPAFQPLFLPNAARGRSAGWMLPQFHSITTTDTVTLLPVRHYNQLHRKS